MSLRSDSEEKSLHCPLRALNILSMIKNEQNQSQKLARDLFEAIRLRANRLLNDGAEDFMIGDYQSLILESIEGSPVLQAKMVQLLDQLNAANRCRK